MESQAKIYIIPVGGGGGWSSDALRSGVADVIFPDGRKARCATRLSIDPLEAETARRGIREKYGELAWFRYFEGHSRVLVLDPAAPTEVRSRVDRIREEFDAAAAEYDRGLLLKPIEQYLKSRTRDAFLDRFRDCDPLLEIGSGTGVETLPLMAAGHTVTAVDISERMLAELIHRARAGGWADQLSARQGRLGDLAAALPDRGAGSFGGAYSSFGAINLETEFEGVPRSLAHFIRPGGWLAFTTLNRPGIAPLVWEFIVGNPRGAFSRFGHTIPPERIRYPLEVHTRPPGEMRDAFAPWFRLENVEAVSILAPPFDSQRMLRWLSRAGVKRLVRIDQRLARIPGAAVLGEWALLTFQRTDSMVFGPTA